MKYLIVALALMTFSGDWAIAPGYSVTFSSSGGEGGLFKGLSGTIHFDPANPADGAINVSIDVATINTGNGLMNTHAKSAEWLDAAKFPKITFVSTSVTKVGAVFQAVGNLTMHGVTKSLTMPFTFQSTATGGSFHATLKVNRIDYNVGKTGDIDDNISVELTVPVTKK